MTENEIAKILVNIFLKVYRILHHKQLLTYLKLTKLKLDLYVNFNVVLVKDSITRIVNQL